MRNATGRLAADKKRFGGNPRLKEYQAAGLVTDEDMTEIRQRYTDIANDIKPDVHKAMLRGGLLSAGIGGVLHPVLTGANRISPRGAVITGTVGAAIPAALTAVAYRNAKKSAPIELGRQRARDIYNSVSGEENY